MIVLGCEQIKYSSEYVTLDCVRDADTIHVKITNSSEDTIYIPTRYVGTYNTNSDTIFLETVDKPGFNRNNYYRYSKLFPFEVYVTKPIPGKKPDSTISIVDQTYLFNQFLVGPFTVVLPHSTNISSCVFYVPQRPDILQAVYYKTPFHLGNKERRAANYLLQDWIAFDSLNAKYVTCEIANRVHLR